MGLFLGPFSGHAVGGGGHGVIDPPPPGTDPGSGPRAEVDTVGRTPLRLLRTGLDQHKPKFMKVVPPGQQRGVMSPPYTWDALERSDWRYESPKRPSPQVREASEFPGVSAPSAPGAAPGRAKDQVHARINSIVSELRTLHQEIRDLVARQQAMPRPTNPGTFTGTQGGAPITRGDAPIEFEPLNKDQARSKALGHKLQRGIAQNVPKAQRDIGFSVLRNRPELRKRGLVADLERSALRLLEDDAEDAADARYGAHLNTMVGAMQKRERRDALGGAPIGLTKSPSPRDQLSQAIEQKRRRVKQLVFELKMLRKQVSQQKHQQVPQQPTESTGLTTNNLRRQSLLLK